MKKLKVTQLIGILLLFLGVIVRAGTGEFWGMYLVVIGILTYAVAKVTAWIHSDRE